MGDLLLVQCGKFWRVVLKEGRFAIGRHDAAPVALLPWLAVVDRHLVHGQALVGAMHGDGERDGIVGSQDDGTVAVATLGKGVVCGYPNLSCGLQEAEVLDAGQVMQLDAEAFFLQVVCIYHMSKNSD